MPRKYTPQEKEAVFFSRIRVNEAPHPRLGTPCHEWVGARTDRGYGVSTPPLRAAHRQAWAYANSTDPGDNCVLHKCDNPPCCNPEHLYLGDQKQNAADREARGRSHYETRTNGRYTMPERTARGERHGSRTKPERVRRGEQNGQHKLTEADILEIRRLAKTGMTRQATADMFGVSAPLISYIVRGKWWKHVVDPLATDAPVR